MDYQQLDDELIYHAETGDMFEFILTHSRGSDTHTHREWALQMAAIYGHIEIIKYLISQGTLNPANAGRILGFAAENGHLSIVMHLVEYLTQLDLPHKNVRYIGGEALSRAASYGHLSVVKYLIEQGMNIYIDDALQWAAGNGHLQVVKYLAEHGADVHAEDDLALYMAERDDRALVVKYLQNLP